MANGNKTTLKTGSSVAETKKQTEAAERQQKPMIPKQIDPHEYIVVRNGSVGKLVYISPRTGERFVWEEFGDEQEMELQELRNAKAANKKFFEKNWFLFDEDYDWVIDYLGARAYYRNAIGIDDFEKLFRKKPSEISKIIAGLSDGQKRSVSYKARQMIAEQKIDSMKVVDTLEKSLGVELIER